MHGLALVTFGVFFASGAFDSEEGTYEIAARSFRMPIRIVNCDRDQLTKIRVYVSTDHGKTWKIENSYEPDVESVHFTAPVDGLYWFATQTVDVNGEEMPESPDELVAAMKVRVNTLRPTNERRKTYEQLLDETVELRKQVKALQQQIRILENFGQARR